MRHVDYAPLFRSTVGFDRLVGLLDAATSFESERAYPPYNIERLDDQNYQITMAVAGFAQSDLKIDVKENALSVSGTKKTEPNDRQFLHRGIGERAFERRFQMADYVEVTGASLTDGLLHIHLIRNLPERMKPRTVAIGTSATTRSVETPQLIAPTH
jgi:molecular chaperone IbpA